MAQNTQTLQSNNISSSENNAQEKITHLSNDGQNLLKNIEKQDSNLIMIKMEKKLLHMLKV